MRKLPTCLVLTFALGLQACRASAPLAPTGPEPRRAIRITSAAPFAVHLVGEEGPARCRATRFEGVVTAVAGDTIRVGTVYSLHRASGITTCRTRGIPFVLSSEITEARTVARPFSPGRTAAMVLIGLPLAAFAAIGLLCWLEPCLA